MILTPQDIQSQQFHVRFRGFDVEEVDAFLERVAEDFLTLVQENKQLHEKIEALTQDIRGYHGQEKTFQSAIITAQKIAEEMTRKSRLEADELLAQTRQEVQKMQDQANDEVFLLEKEIDRLKNFKGKIQDDMRELLHSYLKLVDQGGADEPQAEVPKKEEAATLKKAAKRVASGGDYDTLYEKIDLPDEDPLIFSPRQKPEKRVEEIVTEAEVESQPRFNLEDDSPAVTVPDLEGDMAFTLDDPLDEHAPSITIAEDEEEEDWRK